MNKNTEEDHNKQPLATFFADGTNPIYLCNPYKNHACIKTRCFLKGGECHHTNEIVFAMDKLQIVFDDCASKEKGEVGYESRTIQ